MSAAAEPVYWYEFAILDVPDDATARDARARIARAATAAGVADVQVEGRPDKQSTFWGCRFLNVNFFGQRSVWLAFRAALAAEGLRVQVVYGTSR